jgi:pimeloyl-ACP methyl ester carboxylesterase
VRKRSIAALGAILALTAAACSSNGKVATPDVSSSASPTASTSASTKPTTSLDRFYNQHVDWRGCNDGFQCTTFLVPLNYAKPTGATLKIAAIRLKSSGHHDGSLFINPGGPGGSAISYVRAARSVIPSAVRKHYDVVGYDPRGVGESSPVRCVSGSFLDKFNAVDPLLSASARQETIDIAKQFVAGCKAKSGALLGHVATVDAARDMDVLRAVVGDPKLTYMGKSYGTYLGALYANLFPTHVRALILDGAVDPAESAESSLRIQARGFETALTAFLQNCVQLGCSLGSTYNDALNEFNRLYNESASHPLSGSDYDYADGRTVDRAVFEYGVASALYSRGDWSFLRQALSDAQQGRGGRLLVSMDNLTERNPDGSYRNLIESNIAINCVDRPAPRSLSAYEKDAAAWAKESPHFGAYEAWSLLPCAYWPRPAVIKNMPLHAHGAPPILVIGTSRDPATPFVDAQHLASELDSGVLLSYDGDGHTVYGDGESGCVDRIGNAYLLNLTVPKAGTKC